MSGPEPPAGSAALLPKRSLISLLLALAALGPLLLLAGSARLFLDSGRSLAMLWFNNAVASPLLLIAPLAVLLAGLILRALCKPARDWRCEALELVLLAAALGWSANKYLEFASAAHFAAYVLLAMAALFINSRSSERWAPQRGGAWLRPWLLALTPLWAVYLPRPLWSHIGSRHGRKLQTAGDVLGALLALALVPGLVLPALLGLSRGPRPQAGVTRLLSGSFYGIERDPLSGVLFVASPSDNRLVRLDPADPARPQIAAVPVFEMQTVQLDPRSRTLLHYCRARGCAEGRGAGNDLLAIDADDLSRQSWRPGVAATCKGSTYLEIEPPRDRLFVSCEDSGAFVMDLTSNAMTADMGFVAQTSHMALWPGKALYISLGKQQRLMKFRYDQWGLELSRELDSYPNRLLPVPQRNELLVSLPLKGQILVLDPDTLEERRRIPTVLGARAMVFDPVYGDLFVASLLNWQVAQIDLDSGYEKRRLRVGRWLRWLSLDPTTRTVFVSSRYDGLFSFEY